MRSDDIYCDGKIAMTVMTGLTLQDIMVMFNTKKCKVIKVQRTLHKDGSSNWQISTEPRAKTMLEKIISFIKD